jgi:hypothetical protein
MHTVPREEGFLFVSFVYLENRSEAAPFTDKRAECKRDRERVHEREVGRTFGSFAEVFFSLFI